jgi:hypothetical protein
MLCICAWFTKKDWSSSVIDIFTITSDGLSVGLHRQLLKICWESMHVLIKSVHDKQSHHKYWNRLTEQPSEFEHPRNHCTIHLRVHQGLECFVPKEFP